MFDVGILPLLATFLIANVSILHILDITHFNTFYYGLFLLLMIIWAIRRATQFMKMHWISFFSDWFAYFFMIAVDLHFDIVDAFSRNFVPLWWFFAHFWKKLSFYDPWHTRLIQKSHFSVFFSSNRMFGNTVATFKEIFWACLFPHAFMV